MLDAIRAPGDWRAAMPPEGLEGKGKREGSIQKKVRLEIKKKDIKEGGREGGKNQEKKNAGLWAY